MWFSGFVLVGFLVLSDGVFLQGYFIMLRIDGIVHGSSVLVHEGLL